MIVRSFLLIAAVRLLLQINCCNLDSIHQTEKQTDSEKKESIREVGVSNKYTVSIMAAHNHRQ